MTFPDPALPADTSRPATRSADRVRTVASVITGVLFVIVAVVSLVVAWARATVLDSDRFASAIEQTIAEPEVTRALSELVTERVLAVADVDGYIGANLPEELAPLAQVLRGAARALAVELVDQVVSSPAARSGLVEASRATHRGFITLLEGGDPPPAVSVDGDEIAVNLLPLITESIERLQARGLLGDINVPRLNWGDDPTEQRVLLARAIDRDLPEDFGQVVVYRSERVEAASQMVQNGRAILSLAQRGAWVIYASAVILAVAAVVLARRRLMAIGAVALGSAAALLVARSVILGIVEEVPGLFTNPGAVTAVATSLGDLSRGLIKLLDVVALIAFGLAVFALGAAWRRRSGGEVGPIRALVDERPEFVGIGGFALAILLLSVAGVGWVSILAATALVGGATVVLARSRRAQPNV